MCLQVESQLATAYCDSKAQQLDALLQEMLAEEEGGWARAPLPTGVRDCTMELLFTLVSDTVLGHSNGAAAVRPAHRLLHVQSHVHLRRPLASAVCWSSYPLMLCRLTLVHLTMICTGATLLNAEALLGICNRAHQGQNCNCAVVLLFALAASSTYTSCEDGCAQDCFLRCPGLLLLLFTQAINDV